MPSTPPSPRPPGSPWRHVLEGALSVVAAVLAMALTAWAALALLGAGALAPVSRLVPLMLSMAVGGSATLDSSPSAEPAGSAGGGLGELLGGGGGGLSLGLGGEMAATPLMLTFLGTAVLALGFFRPLRRRRRPTPALLWARGGAALVTAAVVFPLLAAMARGTARLPKSVTQRLGKGASSGALSRLGGGGDGTGSGGGLAKGLSSVDFGTDVVATAFLGLLWVGAVVCVGCLVARRTTLPRPLALSRLRLRWNPVTSTLTGTAAALCCLPLVLALLAAAAALTGREQAARAAGLLLLLGANLIGVLVTAGFGTSWEAGVHRLQAEGGGGMLGMLGGGDRGAAAGADRSVDLGGWTGAGVPLWLIAMTLVLVLLTIAGYVAAARTPARTPREDSEALLDRHTDLALRTGVAVGAVALLLPLLARASVRIGISVMGSEMGGLTAGLTDGMGVSALTGAVLAALASYAGSRLHSRRARRSDAPAPRPGSRRTPGREQHVMS